MPLFPLGSVVATPGALQAIVDAGQEPREFLHRHQSGDWGDCSAEDQQENDFSVRSNLRIFSAYQTSLGQKLWVITEADRSSTCILLPDEY